MKKLFVGNLPFEAQPPSVAQMFLSAGWVSSVKITRDHVTGRSKGFGFVRMPDARAADEAVRILNGAELDGKLIAVNPAGEDRSTVRAAVDQDVVRWLALANGYLLTALSGHGATAPPEPQSTPELLLPSTGMFVPGEDWRVPERWKGRLSVASFVTPQLIAQLAAERSRLLRLEARAFEELCAELLARLGATSVRLTPEGHDRGVDIWATVGGRTGETLCAVQCKRFTPPRPVGRPVLQQMWSIRSTSPARVVAVITTAHFTRDALAYQSDVGSQFALHDGDAVSAWLEACSRQDLPWGA